VTALSVRRPFTLHRDTVRKLASFGVIGVASTLAYVVLYAWLRETTPAGVANALALSVTAVTNTAANRRLTFEVRGRDGLARDHAAGLLALAITSASLAILGATAPQHGRLTEIAVLVVANVVATLVRFLLLRLAIDRVRDARMSAEGALATLSQSERI